MAKLYRLLRRSILDRFPSTLPQKKIESEDLDSKNVDPDVDCAPNAVAARSMSGNAH